MHTLNLPAISEDHVAGTKIETAHHFLTATWEMCPLSGHQSTLWHGQSPIMVLIRRDKLANMLVQRAGLTINVDVPPPLH